MPGLLSVLALLAGIAYGPALIAAWLLAPAPPAVLIVGCAITATIPASARWFWQQWR